MDGFPASSLCPPIEWGCPLGRSLSPTLPAPHPGCSTGSKEEIRRREGDNMAPGLLGPWVPVTLHKTKTWILLTHFFSRPLASLNGLCPPRSVCSRGGGVVPRVLMYQPRWLLLVFPKEHLPYSSSPLKHLFHNPPV